VAVIVLHRHCERAAAAWRFLRKQGIAAEHIAVGGDSAGGNLTLGLISRLRAAGESLPACAWLVSPWTDLTMSGATLDTRDAIDPLIHRPISPSLRMPTRHHRSTAAIR
jgi:acetyl esterase/lipase